MIIEELDKQIESRMDAIDNSLQYLSESINEIFADLSNIRYLMFLKEKIDKEIL